MKLEPKQLSPRLPELYLNSMQNINKYILTNPFRVLLISLFFSVLFVSFFHYITATTQDLNRHLLTGKLILETGHVPTTNLYSYTFPEYPFINTHWLSEVVFYLIAQLLGLQGLLLIMTLTVIVSFALLIIKANYHTDSLVPIAIGTLLLRVLVERTDLRPELFSFLFLSVFLVILFTYRKRSTRLIFLLPLL